MKRRVCETRGVRSASIRAGLAVAAFACVAIVAVSAGAAATGPRASRAMYSGMTSGPIPTGIHKIKHVVIIMQENRSFDSYFGTYPGADGFPTRHGHFTVCVPDPAQRSCDYPYHDPAPVNVGSWHTSWAARADIAGGKMNGFLGVAEWPRNRPVKTDVMGYHDAREIPNYWAYAHDFVLQDHMFEPTATWSLPSHLYLLSEWSAACSSTSPWSCHNDNEQAKLGARDAYPRRQPSATSSAAALGRVRLDRHDISVLQAPRQLGVLRRTRNPARLRRRRSAVQIQANRGTRHSRDLEPDAQLRNRPDRPSGGQHPDDHEVLRRRPQRHASRGFMARAERARTRSMLRRRSTRG